MKGWRREQTGMTRDETGGLARGFAGALRRYWRSNGWVRRALLPAYALLLAGLMLAAMLVWGLLFVFEAVGGTLEYEPIRVS